MEKESFKAKLNELREEYPSYFSPKFLLKLRVILVVIVILITVALSSSLPFYNIICMKDKVRIFYDNLNLRKTRNLIIPFTIIFFSVVLINILIVFIHWLYISKSIKIILVYIFFITFKFIIDLFLKVNDSSLNRYIYILNYKINYLNFFNSNVDLYIGLWLICFYYFLTIDIKLSKKILLILFSLISIIFTFNFLMIHNLSYTYSIITALFVSLFCETIGGQLSSKYNKYFFNDEYCHIEI